MHLGDLLTIICSSILHQLIVASFGVQVKTKNGTVYLGTVVMRSAAFVLIKTNDGKTVKLATGDLVDTQNP